MSLRFILLQSPDPVSGQLGTAFGQVSVLLSHFVSSPGTCHLEFCRRAVSPLAASRLLCVWICVLGTCCALVCRKAVYLFIYVSLGPKNQTRPKHNKGHRKVLLFSHLVRSRRGEEGSLGGLNLTFNSLRGCWPVVGMTAAN